MKTAIIVPTYNRPNLIERMLSSLERCKFPDNVEILIIENGRKTSVEEICRLKSIGGRVKYFFVEKAGRSIALNTGITCSNAEFFIFFDDDLLFSPNIVKSYVNAAKLYGPGHFFGGPLIADAETSCSPHLIPHLPSSCKDWFLPLDKARISLSDEAMFFGANWAGFRCDLQQVGFYSEEIGVSSAKLSPVGEETLIQRKMLESGLIGIYLNEAVIYHLVPTECFSEKWIRNRKMRHGITDFILDMQKPNKIRTLFGVPTWVLLALVKEYGKLVRAKVSFASFQERTPISMRISYLLGVLYGALLHRDKHI